MIYRPVNYRPSAVASAAIEHFLATSPHLAIPEHRVGRFSVDLALPLLNVAVELDGEYWHSLPKMIDRDRRKDEALQAAGWSVVRVVIHRTDTPQGLARRITAAIKQQAGGKHGAQAA
jgi:very-short-patch-repair endonuclease